MIRYGVAVRYPSGIGFVAMGLTPLFLLPELTPSAQALPPLDMAVRAFCRRPTQEAAGRPPRNGSPKTSGMRDASVNAVVGRSARMSGAPSRVGGGEDPHREAEGARR